jgi:predicted outer membrane repeat protein
MQLKIKTILFIYIISNLAVKAQQSNADCELPKPYDMSTASLFGNGTANSCTQVALQELIDKGGKIKCNCGNAPHTIQLNSTLKVPNKEVIIDGQNLVTISGNNSVRIFDKAAALNQGNGTLLGLQNLRLINGKLSASGADGGGAAIMGRAFGSLVCHNVSFENHVASVAHPDECGAVYTILYKEAFFYGCSFKNNKGANGAAIGCIGSGTKIFNTLFESNEATGTGGIPPGKGGNGGAVYMDGADQNGVNNYFEMCGNTFLNNKAGYQAGAVNVIFYAGKNSNAKVSQCIFENSSCAVDKGGAYYHINGPLSIEACNFTNNSTLTQGGAIWCSNTKLSVQNATFVGNKAVSTDKKGGLGGAICIDGSGNEKAANIGNCTFHSNHAGNFASVIFNGGSLTLKNNIFFNNLIGMEYQGNPYGGGAMNKSSNLVVEGGNLQFPHTYKTQFENARTDDWISQVGEAKIIKTDPKLQNQAFNGGFSKTMALSLGSPAIDKGTACTSKDQRGFARSSTCDLGAYEFGATLNNDINTVQEAHILSVYPNPLIDNKTLYIQLNHESYPCISTIYGLEGSMVLKTEILDAQQGIVLPTYLKGSYLIEVKPYLSDITFKKLFIVQ